MIFRFGVSCIGLPLQLWLRRRVDLLKRTGTVISALWVQRVTRLVGPRLSTPVVWAPRYQEAGGSTRDSSVRSEARLPSALASLTELFGANRQAARSASCYRADA